MDKTITQDALRKDIIGGDVLFETPFGLRNLFYADYTASGRGLYSIESTLLDIQKSYANTHTEDDYTGKYLTGLLHQAEQHIKKLVHAGPDGKLFSIGSGSTGALKKLQEIIGVSIPPVTRERVNHICKAVNGNEGCLTGAPGSARPVVFIGPYEHHTNELMWRESLAQVVVVGLAPDGRIDLKDLESKLSDKRFQARTKFASFSAGSNITGVRSPVYDIARICHLHQTPIFFDFAAVAPLTIDPSEISFHREQILNDANRLAEEPAVEKLKFFYYISSAEDRR
ncbi:MAG: aminotransferase class V-fold PLP-dependent enzyme, partial [Acidobacteriota bacterium]